MKNTIMMLASRAAETVENAGGTIAENMPETAKQGGLEQFLTHALPIIGWGFLATFVVVLALIGIVALLNKVTNRKKK